MAALLALAPKLVARPAEERDFPARLRRSVRLGVHEAEHQDFTCARVLNHCGNEAVEFFEIQIHLPSETAACDVPIACRNKKPAGAYRASGPMSANLVALLKPPRARYFAVMMMSVLRRGDIHNGRKYTGAGDLRQEKRS